jgi:small nuclear ribonucleoprotein (snRNP)-like protein
MTIFERYPELKNVVVNLKTGTVFRGVLWRKRGDYLVLRNAEMLRSKNEKIPVDGEVVLDARNVDFIQVVD